MSEILVYLRDATSHVGAKAHSNMPKYHWPADESITFARCSNRIMLIKDAPVRANQLTDSEICAKCLPDVKAAWSRRSQRIAVSWHSGPPSGRGHWWIVWHGIAVPVEVGPALIHRDNPNANLLIKTLGGPAYSFEANRESITYHAVLESPEAP